MIKKGIYILLIIIFAYFPLLPLLRPGFFTIHDGVHPQRIFEMKKALEDFHIPPRWSPDLGYGYGWPQFSFYSPLPYYAGALINFVIPDTLIVVKILYGLAIIFSGLFMYLFVSQLNSKESGLLAGVLYMYSPYHALDLYVRGALAESWAIMLIPLVLYFLVKVIRGGDSRQSKKLVILGAIAYAFLILSHNITALVFTAFSFLGLIVYGVNLVFKKGEFRIFTKIITLFTLGLFLSCYFWLPAILEAKFTYINTMTGGLNAYQNHFIALRQIWEWPWNYGASAGVFSGMSYMVGKIHLILSLACLLLILFKGNRKNNKGMIILTAGIYLVFSLFLTNRRSDIIWANFPFMYFIQFPWRFLIFVSFFVSFLSGAVLIFIKNKYLKISVLTLAVFLGIYGNYGFFKPAKYLDVTQDYFLKGANLYEWATASSEEYLPIFRPKKIVSPPEKLIEVKNGRVKINEKKVNSVKAEISSGIKQEVLVNISYFPGWQVEVNDKDTKIDYHKDGLIRFWVDKGDFLVLVTFKETRIRFFADSITLATILSLLLI